MGGQLGEGERLSSDAPRNSGRHPPPGDALPPFPQRATPARKGARCGAGAGSPRPHRPHPGHTGRGTPAARPRGRAAGGGTAPDTRRPSQRWQATPLGTAPRHPRGTQPPQGMQAEGTVPGPHTRTPAPTARGAQAASPPNQPPAHERHGPAPRGAHSPKPGRGQPGQERPPPKHARRSKGPGQDTRRGTDHVERPYQRPVPGLRDVRTPHHPGGGGADAAGARAHTHAKGTRRIPEGQPDRARGTHRPRGMAYQRARVRDTRTGRPATRSAGHAGREGGNGRDTTPGTGPSPPNRPRAPRTHGRGAATAKAVVAHCATPNP